MNRKRGKGEEKNKIQKYESGNF